MEGLFAVWAPKMTAYWATSISESIRTCHIKHPPELLCQIKFPFFLNFLKAVLSISVESRAILARVVPTPVVIFFTFLRTGTRDKNRQDPSNHNQSHPSWKFQLRLLISFQGVLIIQYHKIHLYLYHMNKISVTSRSYML